jgi:hypothetical protein
MLRMLGMSIAYIFYFSLSAIAYDAKIPLNSFPYEKLEEFKIMSPLIADLANEFSNGKLPKKNDLIIQNESGISYYRRGCTLFREYQFGHEKIGTFNIWLIEANSGFYNAYYTCKKPEIRALLWHDNLLFSPAVSALVAENNGKKYYIKREESTERDRLIIKIDDGSNNRVFAICTGYVFMYGPTIRIKF